VTAPATAPVVLKIGGELLEDAGRLASAAAGISEAARRGAPLVVVHGGGREIDAALEAAGIGRVQVDGLRVTDERTLDVVVSVLAGGVNTRLVAALAAAGVAAVGLTGADGGCGLVIPAPPHRAVDGRLVDLGRVGVPAPASDMTLLRVLLAAGYVPVVACIGADEAGRLYNVNADTLAAHLAGRLGAARLAIAGATPGVRDAAGATVPVVDAAGIESLIRGGTATAGMIAKLRACEDALAAGVPEVVVFDGRDGRMQPALTGRHDGRGTRIMSAPAPALG
jgi:acetylglutamate kinase